MAKDTDNEKSKRKSRAKPKEASPPSPSPPPARKSRGSADDEGEVEVTSGKQPRQVVNWVKNPHWTSAATAYLAEHPDFRRKLFSDSTADAARDGRKSRLQNRESSSSGMNLLSTSSRTIPTSRPVTQIARRNMPRLSKLVFAGELKNEYKDLLAKLGATGAGLNPADIRPGSQIAGLIGEFRRDWPWWDDLHSFWRELPNYNPVGVQSSEPGTDHAADAAQLFQPPIAVGSGDEHEDEILLATSGTENGPEDPGSEYQEQNSDGDEEEEELSDVAIDSWSPSPPPPVPPAKKTGGTKSSAAVTTKPKPKKPATTVDRMQSLRESESERLLRKRELQHKEEMARIQVKRMKYEHKVLKEKNEARRLSKAAMPSFSPGRRNRLLGSPSRLRLLESPSRVGKTAATPIPFPDTQLNLSGGIGHSPASHITPLSTPSHHLFTPTSISSSSTSFAAGDASGSSGHYPNLAMPNMDNAWLQSTAAAAAALDGLENLGARAVAGDNEFPHLPSRSFPDGHF
ncbi:hypothetical protein B0H14DRAFT_3863136 [Mycena olivaceomarginata]|nr:hypothetical protein B0H14DRAFT_3863136 [Mycena olivaceomarginata]